MLTIGSFETEVQFYLLLVAGGGSPSKRGLVLRVVCLIAINDLQALWRLILTVILKL
jgi:hypothetical protein